MKYIAVRALLVSAIGLFCLFGLLGTQVQARPLPAELRDTVPGVQHAGHSTMKVWGFAVYDASLWVAPDFVETAFAQSPLVLELTYLRDFKGSDIARRSVQEMRRQGGMTFAQETAWETQMRVLFPDVRKGDRITGVYQPSGVARFWHNGRWLGEVRDLQFARQFFGIWLSPQTSAPDLRRALLAQRTVAPHTTKAAP